MPRMSANQLPTPVFRRARNKAGLGAKSKAMTATELENTRRDKARSAWAAGPDKSVNGTFKLSVGGVVFYRM